jgi:hypothetical protein
MTTLSKSFGSFCLNLKARSVPRVFWSMMMPPLPWMNGSVQLALSRVAKSLFTSPSSTHFFSHRLAV